jgi:hypothetical protein
MHVTKPRYRFIGIIAQYDHTTIFARHVIAKLFAVVGLVFRYVILFCCVTRALVRRLLFSLVF